MCGPGPHHVADCLCINMSGPLSRFMLLDIGLKWLRLALSITGSLRTIFSLPDALSRTLTAFTQGRNREPP